MESTCADKCNEKNVRIMKLSSLYAKVVKKFRGSSVVGSVVDKTSVIYSGSNIVDSTIGRYSYVGYDCKLDCVDLGSFCSLADHIFIGGREHPMNWVSTSPVFQNVVHSGPSKRFSRFDIAAHQRTVIGNDVWIGHGAVIKAGVQVGHGAVIGSGAVVVKDVPPYAVVVGVPAKVLKYRFEQDIIERLLDVQWWNLPDDELQKKAQEIRNPEKFLSNI